MLSWLRTHPFTLGLAGALVGVVLALLVWQTLVTYARVNALWDLEVRRAQAAQAAPSPSGS